MGQLSPKVIVNVRMLTLSPDKVLISFGTGDRFVGANSLNENRYYTGCDAPLVVRLGFDKIVVCNAARSERTVQYV